MSRTLVAQSSGALSLHPIQENHTFKTDSLPIVELPTPVPSPFFQHATGSRIVKGEDVLYIHPLAIATSPPSMLYMVCDGHSGGDAANYVAANFLRVLNTKLPTKLPASTSPKDVESFAEVVRRAVCDAFTKLDNDWTAVGHMSDSSGAGTTVTVVIAIGYLLTVANVGDSTALLDTGCSILELTGSHRLQNNTDEQSRLKQAGCQLAPLGFHLQGPARQNEIGVGPLRLWPGGLCVSRSVGDLDAGPEVIPLPHIKQVILPSEGCRLIIASDGLWDVVTLSRAVKLTRHKPTQSAASALVTAVTRDQRFMDDTSIIVVDCLPSEHTPFPTIALTANPKPEKSRGGLFSCFLPEMDEPDSRDITGSGYLSFFADVDCLKAYPTVKATLQRNFLHHVASSNPKTNSLGQVDFTMHGARVYGKFIDSNGVQRSTSSNAVADVAGEHNVSNHSSMSLDGSHRNSLMYTVGADYDGSHVEVVSERAFGSAPADSRPMQTA